MACTRRWRSLYGYPSLDRADIADEQRAKPATKREMSQFHTDEYVDFLHRINPENAQQFAKEQVKCKLSVTQVLKSSLRLDNVGDDCPVFDGLFEYCSISAGGSMGQSRCKWHDDV